MRKWWVVPLSYFVIGISLFWVHLDNPFIMDDEIQVQYNDHIQHLDWNTFVSFFNMSTMGGGGGAKMGGVYFKPIMTTYFAVIWSFAGADPFWYRLPLLFFFIMNGVWIYLFSKKHFKDPLIPYFLGLLAIVHSANSEVAFYIADAQDILYMFFGLAALVATAYIDNKKYLPLATIPLLLFATLSKETGVLFLPIVTGYALLVERPKFKAAFIASFVTGVIYVYLRARTGLPVTGLHSNLIFHSAPWIDRTIMLPWIMWHYIEIFFMPWRLTLATDLKFNELSLTRFWLPLTGVLLTVWLLIRKELRLPKNQKPLYRFFGAALILWFILHSHLLQPLDGVYADRWFYMANWIAGSMLFIGVTIPEKHRRLAAMAMVAVCCALYVRTLVRGYDWKSPLQLYYRETVYNPESAVMVNNVGVVLFREGHPKEAKPYFEKAMELNKIWTVPFNNMGAVYEAENDFPKAYDFYFKSMALSPYHQAYENYGRLLYKTGQNELLKKFLTESALPQFPRNATLLELNSLADEAIRTGRK